VLDDVRELLRHFDRGQHGEQEHEREQPRRHRLTLTQERGTVNARSPHRRA
jgi:hypothetical protein